MEYPIRTSESNWLEKALELFMKRTSMCIIDDSGYGISSNSEFIKLFKKITLNSHLFLIFGGLLTIGLIGVIAILFILLSNKNINDTSIYAYLFATILCLLIPIYFIRKNQSPKIVIRQNEVEIIFK
jgi:hypothetical protein